MLNDYTQFKLPDLSGRPKFKIEVNWDKEDEKINKCKVLKITYEGENKKEVFFMKKEHLLGMLFVLGSTEEQQKMIPQTLTKVRHWKSNLYLKIEKNLRKGDILKVPVNITLPAVSEEIIGDLRKDILRDKLPKVDKDTLPSSTIIVPKSIQEKAIENK